MTIDERLFDTVDDWPSTISQVGYPGAGDIDDCWVVATIWGAIASRPTVAAPSCTVARAWAGDPDDGHQDGGSIVECMAIADRLVPGAFAYRGSSFDVLDRMVLAGQPASVALRSGSLPTRLRFGFTGPHQCGLVATSDGQRWLMNPLDASGRDLRPIGRAEIQTAMLDLLATEYRAVVFPEKEALVSGLATRPGADVQEGTFRGLATESAVIRLHDSARIPIAANFVREAVGPYIRDYGNAPGYLIEHQGATCWISARAGRFTPKATAGAISLPVTVGGKLVGTYKG